MSAVVTYTCDLMRAQAELHGWSIGEYSYGAPLVHMWGVDGRLEIGRYCSIGPDVTILLGGDHRTDWVTTYPFSVFELAAQHVTGHPSTRGDVVIGNDVWFGQGVKVMSGVTIGDGACIAAYSLVARDVAPYTIVGGNPARPLRRRFSEQQIAALLDIAWWRWPREMLTPHLGRLLSNDIDAFIAAAPRPPRACPADPPPEAPRPASLLKRLAIAYKAAHAPDPASAALPAPSGPARLVQPGG